MEHNDFKYELFDTTVEKMMKGQTTVMKSIKDRKKEHAYHQR